MAWGGWAALLWNERNKPALSASNPGQAFGSARGVRILLPDDDPVGCCAHQYRY